MHIFNPEKRARMGALPPWRGDDWKSGINAAEVRAGAEMKLAT